ncbi:CinA family nicotinamide mononucleotide deamidase-related protein [Candidatus Nitrospira allomarina]|uniref:CinA-like protein n=1 Tax=Candidatus Nitrospira allomarina TaxID=3020900 RepID=A0AA96GFT9_9BACT|nr:CinA family nicotinamide mononucleotide deamidase-related protein [Candidatus Nitrospira allomarina]WNM56981.1 CinA family nicotinamide mononucleotide deamidase-related protein [Candidatus Nitrospira allomarina]
MKFLLADIIAVGSELLLGGRLDSNSVFVAHLLAECGIEVRKKISVGDQKCDIQEALRGSMKRAHVIVLTGGLGSTLDDCTREAVAATLQCPLIKRKKAYDNLKAYYRRFGRPVTPLLAMQAFLPSRATMLVNTVGTAPGFLMRSGRSVIIALPGVPREAKVMMVSQVQPILRKLFNSNRHYWHHTFQTFGLPESDVQTRLNPFLKDNRNFQIGILASPRGVTVRVSCWVFDGPPVTVKEISPGLLERNHMIHQIRDCLGPWLFAEGERTMEEIVGEVLQARSWTMAVAESCTGGLVAHRLTGVPGSSRYVNRGVVSYSNEAKRELVGVPSSTLRRYGAVSSQVAIAMAKGIRMRSRVDVGVGVTGIAGPGGGTLNKPVGLVYGAIDGPHGPQSQCWRFHGDRAEITLKTSQAVLDLIRRYANEAVF